MQVQFRTDNHITCTDAMAQWASKTIAAALNRYADRLGGVQAHVSDESAAKKSTAEPLLCTLQAHVEGQATLVVKHHGADMNQAIEGAADKMLRQIEHALGRKANA